MNVERKLNLALTVAILNFALLVSLAVSQVMARRGIQQRFEAVARFEQGVIAYRRVAEELEQQRWDNLMQRVEFIDHRISALHGQENK